MPYAICSTQTKYRYFCVLHIVQAYSWHVCVLPGGHLRQPVAGDAIGVFVKQAAHKRTIA